MQLSIIVVVYKMPSQAINTLLSLHPEYQVNVPADSYEVIVVENRSDSNLDTDTLASLGDNFHYYLRDEDGVSPAPAINFALEKCRGEMIGLLIDGARMLTPGVLELVYAARRMYEFPMVSVPGYHLGEEKHHQHADAEQQKQAEAEMLRQMQWQQNGYALFGQAIYSEGNKNGYFHPLMESNALFVRRQMLDQIGGADERFDQIGGGSLNLHLYRALGMIPENQPIILPGEGNFHQFHGGVTTSEMEGRQQMLEGFTKRLDSVWGEKWMSLTRESLYLGKVGAQAQAFLEDSCQRGIRRFNRFVRNDEAPWADQNKLGLEHGEDK